MKVGFIGLGAMGRGMAGRLQAGGYDLVVHDMFREAAESHISNGATWASSPREVAEQSDVVFTSLPTPRDVESVVEGDDGLRRGFKRGAAWFDLSTNSVDVVRQLHATLAQDGVDMLDAPVSGGPQGTVSGRLAIWVGGDRAVFDRHESMLSSIADAVRYIGDIGAGSVAKLTHNMATLAIDQVVVEVLTMGVKAGVDPAALWEAIRAGGAGRSRTFDSVGFQFLTGQFEPPGFELRLADKDARLALELAREVSVPMSLCSLTAAEITEAMNRGWGPRGYTAYLLLQQERAGVPKFELSGDEIQRILAQD